MYDVRNNAARSGRERRKYNNTVSTSFETFEDLSTFSLVSVYIKCSGEVRPNGSIARWTESYNDRDANGATVFVDFVYHNYRSGTQRNSVSAATSLGKQNRTRADDDDDDLRVSTTVGSARKKFIGSKRNRVRGADERPFRDSCGRTRRETPVRLGGPKNAAGLREKIPSRRPEVPDSTPARGGRTADGPGRTRRARSGRKLTTEKKSL